MTTELLKTRAEGNAAQVSMANKAAAMAGAHQATQQKPPVQTQQGLAVAHVSPPINPHRWRW